MGYGKRELTRMKLGVCLDCGEKPVGEYRRCLPCRRRRRKSGQHRAYFKRNRARVRADRASGRGYWPEIHEEI